MNVHSGTTSLTINADLDTAVFEHGRSSLHKGVIEGFCPFGVGEEGILRMEINMLEIWGC